MAKRRIADERDFVPKTLEEAVLLREAAIATGVSPREAAGLMAHVIDAGRGVIRVNGSTLTRYRKILASLDGRYPGPRGRPDQDDPSDAPLAEIAHFTSGAAKTTGALAAAA